MKKENSKEPSSLKDILKNKKNPTFYMENLSPQSKEKQWEGLFFLLEEECFGIRASSVLKILDIPKIHPLPAVPEYLIGVINWRTEIIPVLDLTKYWKLPTSDVEKSPRLLIVKNEDFIVALLVDRTLEVTAIPENSIQKSIDKTKPFVNSQWVLGYSSFQKRVTILLKIDLLLQKVALHG